MTILPACPFPNLCWVQALISADKAVIDIGEHYQKQSLRNRFEILGPNGRMAITIRVAGQQGVKTPVSRIKMIDDEWRRIAKKGVQAAYGSAPFFMHYQEEVEAIIDAKYASLAEFNLASSAWLLEQWGLKLPPVSSLFIDAQPKDRDLRPFMKKVWSESTSHEYPQVFADRFEFQANLSSLDLLMSQGPAGLSEIKIYQELGLK